MAIRYAAPPLTRRDPVASAAPVTTRRVHPEIAEGENAGFYAARLKTARFFMRRLLP